jgi:CRP-like cAMP-binding protein
MSVLPALAPRPAIAYLEAGSRQSRVSPGVHHAVMPESGRPPQKEDRERLVAHSLLRDLDGETRMALIERFQVAGVAAGTSLLGEGEANSRLFVVLEGSVSVKLPKYAKRVSEVKLATLGAGDFFGEYSLFDGQPVSATVFAVELTRVAWLEKAALDAFVDEHHEAGRHFYESIARILIGRLRVKDAELDVVTFG